MTNKTPTREEALKPCPFCGHIECLGIVGDADSDGPFLRAYCPACDAEGPVAWSYVGEPHATQQDAITAWNRRAASSATPAPEGWEVSEDMVYAAVHAYVQAGKRGVTDMAVAMRLAIDAAIDSAIRASTMTKDGVRENGNG